MAYFHSVRRCRHYGDFKLAGRKNKMLTEASVGPEGDGLSVDCHFAPGCVPPYKITSALTCRKNPHSVPLQSDEGLLA